MMKLAVILSAIAGASAFAPVQQSSQTVQLNAATDLDGLRGVGPETGGKVVSILVGVSILAVGHRIYFHLLPHI